MIKKIEEDFKVKEEEKKAIADANKNNFEYDSFLVSGSRSKREAGPEEIKNSNYNSNTNDERLIFIEETESIISENKEE